MALLQITEPGKTTEPHQRKISLGIDLGTTNSLVCSMLNGSPKIIFEGDNKLIPSRVSYNKNDVIVGNLAPIEYGTITSIKRLIGKNSLDLDLNTLPFLTEIDNKNILIKTAQGLKTPIEVSSEILSKLKEIATSFFKDDIYGTVITVPAYFDEGQRQATKDAAKIAGLNVLRLINEPTAAALAYGLDSKKEGIYAIYDLGGGTFDVSILEFSKGVFKVLSTNGNSSLGGDDFDDLIKDFLVRKYSLKLTKASSHHQLNICTKKIKEQLSLTHTVNESIKLDNSEIQVEISVQEFESLSLNLINKTIDCIKNALNDADLNIDDINGVVMVGGSTRMPLIQKHIQSFFKQDLLNDLDPDAVVAMGAARQAQILAGQSNDSDEMLLLDVTPLSLGIETMGELVEKIVPRNSTIPISKAQEFTTYKDGQTMMKIHVLQGEREKVSENRSLAEFILKDIPPLPAGAAKIKVVFQVDADSMLMVSAEEMTTGSKAQIEVKPSYGIDNKSIRKMLEDSFEKADEDKNFRSLAELRVEANQIIELTEKALKEDFKLITDQEVTDLQDLILQLKQTAELEDVVKLKKGIDDLNNASLNLAEKRMDKSINSALTGKNINQIDY